MRSLSEIQSFSIETLVLRKYFPGFLYDYEQNNKTIESLNDQVSTLTEGKKVLETENNHLKKEIESLQKQLSTIQNN